MKSLFSFLALLGSLSLISSFSLADEGKTAAIAPQDARKKASNEGYTEEAQAAREALLELFTMVENAQAVGARFLSLSDIIKLKQSMFYYANFHGACVKTQASASFICREETSPKLQETLNNINIASSMVTSVAITDACSTFAKVARIGQAGLTAYTTACSAARAACEGSCAAVNSNAETVASFAGKGWIFNCDETWDPNNVAVIQACQQLSAKVAEVFEPKIIAPAKKDTTQADVKSIALKNQACTYEYANMILSAGAGIASLMNSFKQGQKCDEDTSGTGGTQTLAQKCADAANASLPECICLANPRTPGCSNELQKVGGSPASDRANLGITDKTNSSDRNVAGGFGGDTTSPLLAESSAGGGGSSLPGAPTGGGSGLGGSSGSGGGAGARDEASAKALDTNILGGAGGGGGGGFRSGLSSSGASAYRSYLPGGAKDPNKGMAGQQVWKSQVTGQGGKSNWDKIKERYRDNKNTLLSN